MHGMQSLKDICLSKVSQCLFTSVRCNDLEGSIPLVKRIFEGLPSQLATETFEKITFQTFPDWEQRIKAIELDRPTKENFHYCSNLVMWCRNKEVFIHQKTRDQELITTVRHDEPIYMVRKAPKAPLLATVSAQHLFLYRLEQLPPTLLHTIPLQNSTTVAFSWSGDDPMLCVGNNQGKVSFFNKLFEKEIETSEGTFTDPTGKLYPSIQSLAIAQSGQYVMIGCENQPTYVVYLDNNKIERLDCFNDTKNIHEIIISPSDIIACNVFHPIKTFIFKYSKDDERVIHRATIHGKTAFAIHDTRLLLRGTDPHAECTIYCANTQKSQKLFKYPYIHKLSFCISSAYGNEWPCLFKEYNQSGVYTVLVPSQLSMDNIKEDNVFEKFVYKLAVYKAISCSNTDHLNSLANHPILKTFHQSDLVHSFLTRYVQDIKNKQPQVENEPSKFCSLQ